MKGANIPSESAAFELLDMFPARHSRYLTLGEHPSAPRCHKCRQPARSSQKAWGTGMGCM